MFAGDIPELQPLFDEILGPAPTQHSAEEDDIPATEDEAEPPVATVNADRSGPPGVEVPAAEPEALGVGTPFSLGGGLAEPPPPAPGPPEAKLDEGSGPQDAPLIVGGAVAKAKPSPLLRNLLVGGGGLIALILVSQLLKPATHLAAEETDYVTRATMVRREPSAASGSELGELSRGDKLVGRPVAGKDGSSKWLKITEGAWKDDFVWMSNLSHDERPALSASTGRTARKLKAQAVVRATPDASASSLMELDPGDTVTVLGRTATGWREIELKGGGVGYLPPAAFGETAPDAPSAAPVAAAPPAAKNIPPPVPGRLRVELKPPPQMPFATAPAPPSPAAASPPPPPAPPTRGAEYLTNPPWIRRPSADDQARLAPSRAMDQNQSGRAGVDCQISGSGQLTDCSVTEDPAGWGFGQAALSLARLYLAAPQTSDRKPTAGQRVKINFRFQFDQ